MSGRGTLRIGTRGSALALWQARHVEALIGGLTNAPSVELVHIKTEGDVRTDVPLWAVGGRSFFTKEIDRALLADRRAVERREELEPDPRTAEHGERCEGGGESKEINADTSLEPMPKSRNTAEHTTPIQPAISS